MQRFRDVVLVEGPNGLQPLPTAQVTVYLAGTQTLANIFSNNTGSPKENPMQVDSLGELYFYAEDGRYDLKISAPGYGDVWVRDVLLDDPEDNGYLTHSDIAVKSGVVDPEAGYGSVPSVGQPDGEGSLNAQAIVLTAYAKANRGRLDDIENSSDPLKGAAKVGYEGSSVAAKLDSLTSQAIAADNAISDLEERALSGEFVSYETEAAMLADTGQAQGTSGRVTNDPDPAKDGYYTWYSPNWVRSGIQPVSQQTVDAVEAQAMYAIGAYGEAYALPGYEFRPDMWYGFVPQDMDQDASGYPVDGESTTSGLAKEIDLLALSAAKFSPDRWYGNVGGPADLDQSGYVVGGAMADEGLAKEIDSGGGGGTTPVRMRVDKQTTSCSVYCKGAGGQNWIEYNLIRQTNSNRDLWRMAQAYECDADLIRIRALTPDSEWLCAIREPNAVIGAGGDATGGWHGYEYMTEAYWLVDGVYQAAGWTGTASPQKFELVHKSNINRWGSTDLLCRAVKHLVFDENGVDIIETLEWLPSGSPIVGPISMLSVWMPMLPIRRNQDGSTGALITDHATRERAYVRMDVAEDNLAIEDVSTFNTSGTPTYTFDSARCTTWGDTSGISATSRMLSSEMWTLSGGELVPLDPNPEAYFYIDIRAAQYNKHYWNVGRSMTVNAGDFWRVHARIEITTRN